MVVYGKGRFAGQKAFCGTAQTVKVAAIQRNAQLVHAFFRKFEFVRSVEKCVFCGNFAVAVKRYRFSDFCECVE